jgi:hypothetical protein
MADFGNCGGGIGTDTGSSVGPGSSPPVPVVGGLGAGGGGIGGMVPDFNPIDGI